MVNLSGSLTEEKKESILTMTNGSEELNIQICWNNFCGDEYLLKNIKTTKTQ